MLAYIAVFGAAAIAGASAASTPSADVWLRFDGCRHLGSSTPYGYAGIDSSWFPGA